MSTHQRPLVRTLCLLSVLALWNQQPAAQPERSRPGDDVTGELELRLRITNGRRNSAVVNPGNRPILQLPVTLPATALRGLQRVSYPLCVELVDGVPPRVALLGNPGNVPLADNTQDNRFPIRAVITTAAMPACTTGHAVQIHVDLPLTRPPLRAISGLIPLLLLPE